MLIRKILTFFADTLTSDGKAFIGRVDQAAVAAEYSHGQILNPAGSGKVVYVDRVEISSGAAASDYCSLSFYDTAMTTDIGAVPSRNAGGAALSAHVRKQANATVLGTIITTTRVPLGQSALLELNPPIRLVAGKGLGCNVATVNVQLYANFYGREYSA